VLVAGLGGVPSVDMILPGGSRETLLVEQSTKFQVVVNLATGKALGLRVPPSLLGQADEVIE